VEQSQDLQAEEKPRDEIPPGLSALNGAKAGAFAYGSCLKTRLV